MDVDRGLHTRDEQERIGCYLDFGLSLERR
jgi:hypothetical protein